MTTATMTTTDLAAVLAAYLDELHADAIDPRERIAVACVLADLCRLAGLPLPLPVAAALEARR